MAKESSPQGLANLIQAYDQVVAAARALYGDDELKRWAMDYSKEAREKAGAVKQKLMEAFDIDYDSDDAAKQVIKEGSEVAVLVNHMEGMKGATAFVKSYSLPALLSDMVMTDGMKMNNHKWVTNDEVKLK